MDEHATAADFREGQTVMTWIGVHRRWGRVLFVEPSPTVSAPDGWVYWCEPNGTVHATRPKFLHASKSSTEL